MLTNKFILISALSLLSLSISHAALDAPNDKGDDSTAQTPVSPDVNSAATNKIWDDELGDYDARMWDYSVGQLGEPDDYYERMIGDVSSIDGYTSPV
ncbi:hypothetical protein H0X48_06055 [Candidatus Dependentiae bacterium]|nr:hypothetical protein [Candidatus Dependentiae bacterium]